MQLTRRRQPKASQRVAADVHGHSVCERRAQRRHALHADDIMQERAELDGVVGYPLARSTEMPRVRAHMQRAATRQHDDLLVVRKGAHERRERRRARPLEAGIRGRLTATACSPGNIHLDAEPLQELQRGDGDARVQLIDVAGREESDRQCAECPCRL